MSFGFEYICIYLNYVLNFSKYIILNIFIFSLSEFIYIPATNIFVFKLTHIYLNINEIFLTRLKGKVVNRPFSNIHLRQKPLHHLPKPKHITY